MKILFIDDEIMFTKLLKLNLEILTSYKVFTFNKGGKEAIKYIEKLMPDLIFLDVVMPNNSEGGFELGCLIKKNSKIKNIPFLFLTGLSNYKQLEKSQYLCILQKEKFVSKPLDTKGLIKMIKKYDKKDK